MTDEHGPLRHVPRETVEKLRAFEGIVRAEAEVQNLVAASTLDDFWNRHIIDAAQLVRFEPWAGASWIDIGSGAGIPGIILACLVEGRVTLVEPRRLRADFLQRTIAALGLPTTVIQAKSQNVQGQWDVITGRAVASLTSFLEITRHLSTEKSRWVVPKGRSAVQELEEARKTWQAVFHVEPSVTDPEAAIITVSGLRKKGRK